MENKIQKNICFIKTFIELTCFFVGIPLNIETYDHFIQLKSNQLWINAGLFSLFNYNQKKLALNNQFTVPLNYFFKL